MHVACDYPTDWPHGSGRYPIDATTMGLDQMHEVVRYSQLYPSAMDIVEAPCVCLYQCMLQNKSGGGTGGGALLPPF